MSDFLITKIENGIGEVILNRPDVHNAFDDELILALIETFEALDQSPFVKVVVLRSNGKHFSAGADLNWMKRMANMTEGENQQDAAKLAEMLHRLDRLSKPTIALVQGAAFGGAVGLVACCDIAIVSERAKFCLSEVKIGLSPATISPFVVAAMGQRAARRYFLTAEAFDANEAKRIGFVHEVVAEDQLVLKANEVIQSIIGNGPKAVEKTKALIHRVARGEINQSLIDDTVGLIASIRVSEEGQEGLDAFLTKRKPNWLSEQPVEIK